MSNMNREWVLQNLRETIEHIEDVIRNIEAGNDGVFCESYMIAIYRDLNRAWNGRLLESIQAGVRNESLCRFPVELPVVD